MIVSGNGIKGAAELEARLKQLGTEMATKMIQSADRQAAKVVADAIRSAAPEGPDAEGAVKGHTTHSKIKNHIKIKKGKSSNQHAACVIVHTGEAFQALFYERGTIHQAPRPFAGPAFLHAKDAALAKMGTALEKGLERAARSGNSGMSPHDVQVDT